MTASLTIQKNAVTLDTGIDQTSFGKMRLASGVPGVTPGITEQGFLASCDGSRRYRFIPWTFTGIQILPDGHAAFTGTLPADTTQDTELQTATLSQLLEQNSPLLAPAVSSVCRAVTQAADEQLPLRAPGAGGIIILSRPENSIPDILFVPAGLFETAAASCPRDAAAIQQGYWINQGAENAARITFLRAALAYRLLSGRVPYAETDPLQRRTDISDGACIPVQYLVRGIDSSLAAAINTGLTNLAVTSLQDAARFPLDALDKQAGIAPDGSFIPAAQSEEQSQKREFQQYAEKMIRRHTAAVRRRRMFRKHGGLIIAGAVAVIAVCIGAVSAAGNYGRQRVSTGLSASQTAAAFYQGIDNQDTELMTAMTKGKAGKAYIDSVSAIFVAGKMRQAYENIRSPLTPKAWLGKGADPSLPVYGITGLRIDGTPYDIQQVQVLRRNQHPLPATENGTSVAENSERRLKIDYYLVCTQGDNLLIQQFTDTVTLRFSKGAWLITGIDGSAADLHPDMESFRSRLTEALKAFPAAADAADNSAALDALRPDYPWLP